MTGDPLGAYRVELRNAAAHRASAHQRRRRGAVTLAVATAAVLLVGGAIAGQASWFETPSTQFQRHAVEDHLDRLTKGYANCMTAHGSHRIRLPGGGSAYRHNAAAASACEPFHSALVATCLIPTLKGGRGVIPLLPSERVTPARAAACVSAALTRAVAR
jgi:hypothetical protein